MKVKKTVRVKIAQLIQRYKKRKAVADLLGIHVSYIYKMEAGKAPGQRLYRDICELVESKEAPGDKI